MNNENGKNDLSCENYVRNVWFTLSLIKTICNWLYCSLFFVCNNILGLIETIRIIVNNWCKRIIMYCIREQWFEISLWLRTSMRLNIEMKI